MILPTKHLDSSKALLTIGADILGRLAGPKTVSRIWEEVTRDQSSDRTITYDWFVLALDWLFAAGLIEQKKGVIGRAAR